MAMVFKMNFVPAMMERIKAEGFDGLELGGFL